MLLLFCEQLYLLLLDALLIIPNEPRWVFTLQIKHITVFAEVIQWPKVQLLDKIQAALADRFGIEAAYLQMWKANAEGFFLRWRQGFYGS